MKLRQKDIKFVMSVWKQGRFISYKHVGATESIQRLGELGIIKKTDDLTYIINRKKFIEVQKASEEDGSKQEELFNKLTKEEKQDG